MSILRVYDPSECDEQGVPLDWERCRACSETGRAQRPCAEVSKREAMECEVCGGHGSLKAAALAYRAGPFVNDEKPRYRKTTDPIRCESCSHPMSEGTWTNPLHEKSGGPLLDEIAMHDLVSGQHGMTGFHEWAERKGAVHYSPCDEGCTHGGDHVRWHVRWQGWIEGGRITEPIGQHITRMGPPDDITRPMPIEASWRPVGIRCLGWPYDLRPEKLAVLCLRCFAKRRAAR